MPDVPSQRVGLKVVIAVAAMAGAGALTYRFLSAGQPQGQYAKDAEPPSWTCLACGHQFKVSFDEIEKLTAAANAQPAPEPEAGDDPPGTFRARRTKQVVTALRCEKCGETKAVLSTNRCEEHDLYYPNQDLSGAPGACPKCTAATDEDE